MLLEVLGAAGRRTWSAGGSPILEIPEEFEQEFVIADYYPPLFPAAAIDGDIESESDEHDEGSPSGANENVDYHDSVSFLFPK